MGLTANVADGDVILASWGNAGIRDHTLQVFATAAERDQQWPASVAPNGAHCVTMDANIWWRNVGNVWTPLPGQRLAQCTVANGGGDVTAGATVATFDFATATYPRWLDVVFQVAGTQISAASVTSLTVALNGTGIIGTNGPSIPTGASDGIRLAGLVPIAANTAGVLTGLVGRVSGTGAYRLAVDGRFSYLHAVAWS